MIAYNQIALDNLQTRDKTRKACQLQYITQPEKDAVFAAYPTPFYSPNIFVRIGLFILTVVIGLFELGFMALLFLNQVEHVIGGLLIFFGLINYVVLELMVKKKHYRSGVDDALTWMAGLSIFGGLNMLANISWQTNAILIFIVSAFLFLRFANMLIAGVAGISVIAFVFLSFIRLGEMAKALAPFVVMITSAAVYLFATRKIKEAKWRHYFNGLLMISIVSLISFYAGGNYFVVREASVAMFDLDLTNGENIPFAWLFWLLTFAIPVLYIIRGLQKKDIVLLRTGLVLVAAGIFTVPYYYHPLPLETAAVIAGIIMIGIAWAVIKYLHEPKFGFTNKKDVDPHAEATLQLESLLIVQTLGTQQPADSGFQFGGGTGGGGGATGEY